jgi:hypothetical protein
MDFGFMRASSSDLSPGVADRSQNRVVFSYDGFSSYLLLVDKASRYIWVFLTKSKEPPLNIVSAFLRQHDHPGGGCICTDQGGELARSMKFSHTILNNFNYTVEHTSNDSPSQNGAVKIYNDKFGIRTRALLYGSGLPAKFWSAALLHSVFLHNRLIHAETKKTPFEGYYGAKPDLSGLKVFGSRVCISLSGKRRAKLDHNDFTCVFLCYSATNQNIIYLDLTSSVVKTSHHTEFDEAWYLQPSRPPAAQLLYDLGLEFEDDADDLNIDHESTLQIPVRYPPLAPITTHPDHTTTSSWPPPPAFTKLPRHTFPRWTPPPASTRLPLPLRETAAYQPRTAAAAQVLANTDGPPNPQLFALYQPNPPQRKNASELVSEFLIGKHNMAMIYLSPNPYFNTFEEIIDIRRFDLSKHRLVGLCLTEHDGHLFLGGISPSTPTAKKTCWRT